MGFRFLTSGESHGKCLTVIVEGVPAGIEINENEINKQLARRQQGYGRGGRMQIEKDKVIINSGVRHGRTTGAPICMVIENKDWANWGLVMAIEQINLEDEKVKETVAKKRISQVRPGHADLPGALKYNHEDVRNVLERSSARKTAARVAVGALAQIILEEFGIEIFSHITRIGPASVNKNDLPQDYTKLREQAEDSETRCACPEATQAMKNIIDKSKETGDSLGGLFEVVALNAPVGLGSYVHWDRRIDGLIAQAMMSIPAIKSVGIGAGEQCAELTGAQMHDEIFSKKDEKNYQRKTNNAGGIEGGITNGCPIVVNAAMKAIPTMKKPLNSINLDDGQEHIAHYERSDVCAVPAAGVVGEAMLAIVLVQALFEKFGGDSLLELKMNFDNYCDNYQKR